MKAHGEELQHARLVGLHGSCMAVLGHAADRAARRGTARRLRGVKPPLTRKVSACSRAREHRSLRTTLNGSFCRYSGASGLQQLLRTSGTGDNRAEAIFGVL